MQWMQNSSKYKPLLVTILLVIGCIAIFHPVIQYDFINYDDNIYVTSNTHVRDGLSWRGLQWAFGALEAGFWHPLTWLSLMIDHTLYGLNAGGYHWTNLLFHIASTVLLFLSLYRMSGALWRSGLVAALFACHPINVEPVAWIASRKDVLSTFFWMMTLLLYNQYAVKGGIIRYILVVLGFMMGLMSKPITATLPFVFLLLDYWPLGRWEKISILRLFTEKLPLMALAFIIIGITFVAEKKMGALVSLGTFPLDVRIYNAAVSYIAYIAKMFWPIDLAVFYPHPGYWPLWKVIFSVFLLLGITLIVLKYSRRFPYLPVGWFWYVGTLVPVIGIVQIGSHAMADRYAYIPFIGLFIIISWGIADFVRRSLPIARLVALAVVVAIIAFASAASLQVRHWQNSITLFKNAAAVAAENYLAHYNLGIAYRENGDLSAAIDHFEKAGKLRPDLSHIQNNLGVALMLKGDSTRAMAAFDRAIQLQPGHAGAHNNLGVILYSKGRINESIDHLQVALKLQPDYANAHYYLSLVLRQKGETAAADYHLKRAIEINPEFGGDKNRNKDKQSPL